MMDGIRILGITIIVISCCLIFISNYLTAKKSKKYYQDMQDGILNGLRHKVILVEGRCAKCNEKIDQNLLTNEDIKNPKLESHEVQ